MADYELSVTGAEELQEKLEIFAEKLYKAALKGVDKATKNTAEDIKVIFKGGSSPGFKDRTGALRGSIKGGLSDEFTDRNEVVGFISAGDNSIGTDGKQTREYVERVEFGEFSRAGKTSFLRAGTQMSARQIGEIIMESLDVEQIINGLNR